MKLCLQLSLAVLIQTLLHPSPKQVSKTYRPHSQVYLSKGLSFLWQAPDRGSLSKDVLILVHSSSAQFIVAAGDSWSRGKSTVMKQREMNTGVSFFLLCIQSGTPGHIVMLTRRVDRPSVKLL